MTNRSETKEIGGRSRNPILIASQVELQTTQSASHAAGIRQSARSRLIDVVFTRGDFRVAGA